MLSLNSVNSGKPQVGNPEPNPCRGKGAETKECTKEELAYATMLGDGYITSGRYKRKSGVITECNSWFVFAQSHRHKDYVDWLANLFSCYWKIKKEKRIVSCGRNNKKYLQYNFRTKAYPFFTHLRKKVFYPNNRKRITQKILSKITPLGIAIWWMDDGNLSSINQFTLCTDSYTLKEVRIIQEWFLSKWNIRWNITKIHRLQCYMKEGIKLIKLIQDYIILSMKYKITPYYHNLNYTPYKAELLELFQEEEIVRHSQ